MPSLTDLYGSFSNMVEKLSPKERKLLLEISRKIIERESENTNASADAPVPDIEFTEEEQALMQKMADAIIEGGNISHINRAKSQQENRPIPAQEELADDMERMEKTMEQYRKELEDTEFLMQAIREKRKRAVENLKSDAQPKDEKPWYAFSHKNKEKPWYDYLFANLQVKEIIASSGPKHMDPAMIELFKLTPGYFAYIVYLDNNNQLKCAEQGDIEKIGHYDFEEDNAAIVRIREAETFPTSIMTKKGKHDFLIKLGLAHQMRYEGCYKQVEPLIKDALLFAEHRNMTATRLRTLTTATVGSVIAISLLAIIHYMVPEWDSNSPIVRTLTSDGLYAGIMGIIGGYTSLWLRYRSLGELSFGGRQTVSLMTACRLLIGAIFAYIANLAVRCGLLFPALEGHAAAIGLISFVAGFSERLVPSFIKGFVLQSAKFERKKSSKLKDTNDYVEKTWRKRKYND